MVILIGKWTLILKNGMKWSFSYETKASTHLSQWGEWNYGAQSLKERRLLCESMLILVKRLALFQKLVERDVFLIKLKQQFIYPHKENALMVPNHVKKGDYCVNPCLSHLADELWF